MMVEVGVDALGIHPRKMKVSPFLLLLSLISLILYRREVIHSEKGYGDFEYCMNKKQRRVIVILAK